MTKLVILKFNGNLESGFQVNLEIGPEGKSASRGLMGNLPPAPELIHCLTQWQQQYHRQENNQRIKPKQIIYDGSFYPQQKLVKNAQKLKLQLQQWLNSPSFSNVDKHLREELNRQEKIRMLICSDRPQIYQLPWCCWDIVENYSQLEIAVSNFNFELVPVVAKAAQHHKVRILAILGNNRGINLEADRTFLTSLTDGEVKFLVEPTIQELYDYLWQQPWDIVFFAGHSKTVARQGILSLNSQDNLTIEQLRNGFKQAISSGLQLAIFNSCDGLGLAEELGKLSLPQSIVMRLPIPDIMAQQFVKYFLKAYAEYDSLYIAMRQAREKLQGWEKQFPGASWLPTIYQNPAVIPPDWKDLRGDNNQPFDPPRQPSSQKQNFTSTIMIAILSAILVGLIQSWGWLETSELKAYDRFMGWRRTLPLEERVLVVTIQDEDIQYQRQQMMNMPGSLADAALNQLLTKLQPWQPKAIASDVIHDFPFSSALTQTISQTDNFFAICRIQVKLAKLVSIAPPFPLAEKQLGFSNLAIDHDGAIRRQVLGMAADDVCQSDLSLSLRLALKYLDNPTAKLAPEGVLRIGEIPFPKLASTSGGYHLPEAQGYQILLNYRRALPTTISLSQILTMPQQSLEPLVKDKIVLIGVVGHNNDLHHTPYSRGKQAQRLPGVMIHAQMTGQIIDVVSGKQQLLWWLPDQVEFLWIAVWSIVGSAISLWGKASFNKIAVATIASLAGIFICCWLLFLNGIWLIAIAPALALLLSATIKSIRLN